MEKKQAIKEKYGLLSKTKVIALLKYFYLFPTSLSVSSFLQRLSFHASLSTGHSGIKIKSASVTIPESKIRLISTKAKYIKKGERGGGLKCTTFQNQAWNSTKIRATAMNFCRAVGFIENNIELWRKGDEPLKTAISCRFCCCYFSLI